MFVVIPVIFLQAMVLLPGFLNYTTRVQLLYPVKYIKDNTNGKRLYQQVDYSINSLSAGTPFGKSRNRLVTLYASGKFL